MSSCAQNVRAVSSEQPCIHAKGSNAWHPVSCLPLACPHPAQQARVACALGNVGSVVPQTAQGNPQLQCQDVRLHRSPRHLLSHCSQSLRRFEHKTGDGLPAMMYQARSGAAV